MIYICNCKNNYKIIDLTKYYPKNFLKYVEPLYIETEDNCKEWTSALFYQTTHKDCQFGFGYSDVIQEDFIGKINDSIK